MSNELIGKIKIQNEKRILIFDYEKKNKNITRGN